MVDKIKVGDTVKIEFGNSLLEDIDKAEVIYVPSSTGDSWVVKDINTIFADEVKYISLPCIVTLAN